MAGLAGHLRAAPGPPHLRAGMRVRHAWGTAPRPYTQKQSSSHATTCSDATVYPLAGPGVHWRDGASQHPRRAGGAQGGRHRTGHAGRIPARVAVRAERGRVAIRVRIGGAALADHGRGRLGPAALGALAGAAGPAGRGREVHPLRHASPAQGLHRRHRRLAGPGQEGRGRRVGGHEQPHLEAGARGGRGARLPSAGRPQEPLD